VRQPIIAGNASVDRRVDSGMPPRSQMLSIALAVVLASACSDEDDGVAPTISALTFAPATVPVGQTTAVSGSFQFADDDGDVDQLEVAVTAPGGAAQTLPPVAIQGVAGQTAGAVTWAVQLTPPTAGDYLLDITVVDAAQHTSNTLTATIGAP